MGTWGQYRSPFQRTLRLNFIFLGRPERERPQPEGAHSQDNRKAHASARCARYQLCCVVPKKGARGPVCYSGRRRRCKSLAGRTVCIEVGGTGGKVRSHCLCMNRQSRNEFKGGLDVVGHSTPVYWAPHGFAPFVTPRHNLLTSRSSGSPSQNRRLRLMRQCHMTCFLVPMLWRSLVERTTVLSPPTTLECPIS